MAHWGGWLQVVEGAEGVDYLGGGHGACGGEASDEVVDYGLYSRVAEQPLHVAVLFVEECVDLVVVEVACVVAFDAYECSQFAQ